MIQVQDIAQIYRKLKFLLHMNQPFDFNDIFADICASFHVLPQPEDKPLHQGASTSFMSNSDSHEDELVDYFSLERQESCQVNHIWSQNHDDLMMENIQCARKDTAADSLEIYQDKLSKENKRKRKFDHSQKNETKNIPKNFGKAILAFIQKHKKIVKSVMEKYKAGTPKELIEYLEMKKKEITTIADLRALWIDNPYEKVIRTLSCLFLRKYSLNYIFNSRVCNFVSHIKYRQRFLQAIQAPNQFKHIKDF